jgi:two-component system nitrate/nitrite sensor histidine kinase NarX
MLASPGFYAQLSALFDHMARDPGMTPAIALQQWLAGSESEEVHHLEALQETLAALQACVDQERQSGAAGVERPYRSIFEAVGDGLIIVERETGRVVEANPAAGALHGYARHELIGLPVTHLIHPDSHRLFNQHAEGLQPGNGFAMLVVHVRKGGTSFHAEVRWAAFTYRDRPCLLGLVRNLSDRVQAEQMLWQQVETRAREQTTLLEISQTLASSLELNPGLILDELRGLIEYTHASLFALDGSRLVALATRGSARLERAMPFDLPLNDTDVVTSLLNSQQPNRITDVWSADPAARSLRSLLNGQAAMLLQGVRAWMWVPLTAKGHMIGGLGIAHAEPDYFTAHHAALAMTMANQVAITMVNTQLYEDAQTFAKLQERQRLAQELHDAVNQSLFSAGLIAEVLPRLWEQNPDEGRRSLEDLRRLTRGALAEMRGLLAELRPAVMTGSDFGDLLRQLGNALTGRVNVPVSMSITGEGVLPANVQIALYRLCQEALNNIAKHAGANQVTIHLHYHAEGVELHIQDDGRGFDPAQSPSGHSGLSMMRERAEAVSALLSITSVPGRGTTVVIRWGETPQQDAL